MVTMRRQPHLEESGKALRHAVHDAGRPASEIAKQLNISDGTLSNRMNGKSSVTVPAAKAMAKAIGPNIDWHPFVSPPRTGPVVRRGPAERAALMHADSPRVIPPASPPAGVMGMTASNDGTMSVWLKTTLPIEQGATLVRYLLDFGLIVQNGRDADTSAPMGMGKG
jgi:transcriptional regulator with XRE-family HTH domain